MMFLVCNHVPFAAGAVGVSDSASRRRLGLDNADDVMKIAEPSMSKRSICLIFDIPIAVVSVVLCVSGLWLWLDLWRDNRELAITAAYFVFPVAAGLIAVAPIMLWNTLSRS
jgi:hypothetical protein